MEIAKKKNELKSQLQDVYNETESKQKLLRNAMANSADNQKDKVKMAADNQIKQNGLQSTEESS